jgi:hypothetical protein
MKRIVTLLVVNLLLVSVFAQVQVYPLENLPEKMKYTGSVTYAMPTTTLKVTVSVSKVQDVRGYFADYAESLLGLTNIVHQNRTHYVLNSVEIEPSTTADLTNVYRAYTSNAVLAEAMNAAALTPQSSYPDGYLTSYQTHTASLPDFFKNYADISYTQQQETFVDTKIIDGVVTQVPANHTKTVSKSFENKAREAADAIMKSRKDQYNLVAGEQETPYTGEALAIMLSELKNWESNYMSLFTGVSIADTIQYVFYFTPNNKLEQMTAFYFNENKGLVPTAGAAADAYTLKFNSRYPKMFEVKEWYYPQSGFITRNMQPVCVSLSHDKTVHDFGMVNMYQAGSIFVVQPSVKESFDINQIGIVF